MLLMLRPEANGMFGFLDSHSLSVPALLCIQPFLLSVFGLAIVHGLFAIVPAENFLIGLHSKNPLPAILVRASAYAGPFAE